MRKAAITSSPMQETSSEDGSASRSMPLRRMPMANTPSTRAEQPSVAALEGGAADSDGGDGVELHADAGRRMPGIQPRGEQQRADARHEPGQRIDRAQHEAAGNAGEHQRLPVAAEREDVGAEGGSIEQPVHQRIGDDHDDDRHGDVQDRAGVDGEQAGRHAGDALAAAEREGEPLRNAERAERRHERRQIEVGDEPAVEQAEGEARSKTRQKREHDRAGRKRRRRHAQSAERQHRAHGYIQPLRHDHEGHRQGEKQQDARLHQHVREVGKRREIGARHREQNDERDEHHRDARHAREEARATAGGGAHSCMPRRTMFSGVSAARDSSPAIRPARMT